MSKALLWIFGILMVLTLVWGIWNALDDYLSLVNINTNEMPTFDIP